MLPNRMQLNRTVEEQLKRLKAFTGVTPNVSARIAFFHSIESGYNYNSQINYKLDGNLTLDKTTWLGKTQQITELFLIKRYPTLNQKELQVAWASHVDSGIAALRSHKNLPSLVGKLLS